MKIWIQLILISSGVFFYQSQETPLVQNIQSEVNIKSNPKLVAYEILREKCNVCHQTKNPGKVFTPDNMNPLASKIYKQVFIKKRMPKGNKIKLTEDEYAKLKKWLLTQEINK